MLLILTESLGLAQGATQQGHSMERRQFSFARALLGCSCAWCTRAGRRRLCRRRETLLETC